jgi:hypothetical protein
MAEFDASSFCKNGGTVFDLTGGFMRIVIMEPVLAGLEISPRHGCAT